MMNLDEIPEWVWMAVVLLGLVGALLFAVSASRRRARMMQRLGNLLQLPASSQPAVRPPFALDDGVSGLIFADNTVIVVDLREGGSLVQRLELDQIAALKIYEHRKDRIAFRLVTQTCAESRRIETPGVAALTQLMDLVSTCGARIEYIPEAR